jgi:integrase/recombinase XerD
MQKNLEIKGYSRKTQKTYLREVEKFTKHFNKSPEDLGTNEIKDYLHYIITKKMSTPISFCRFSPVSFSGFVVIMLFKIN